MNIQNSHKKLDTDKDDTCADKVKSVSVNKQKKAVVEDNQIVSHKMVKLAVDSAVQAIASKYSPSQNNTDGGGFTEVVKRRRRRVEQKIGRATEDRSNGQLAGAAEERKAWFYLGKIRNKDATVDMARAYLSGEERSENFIVEKLVSKGECAAFKIGVPFGLKEKLDDENYWPAGVCIRRFYFPIKRGGHFLLESAQAGV